VSRFGISPELSYPVKATKCNISWGQRELVYRKPLSRKIIDRFFMILWLCKGTQKTNYFDLYQKSYLRVTIFSIIIIFVKKYT